MAKSRYGPAALAALLLEAPQCVPYAQRVEIFRSLIAGLKQTCAASACLCTDAALEHMSVIIRQPVRSTWRHRDVVITGTILAFTSHTGRIAESDILQQWSVAWWKSTPKPRWPAAHKARQRRPSTGHRHVQSKRIAGRVKTLM